MYICVCVFRCMNMNVPVLSDTYECQKTTLAVSPCLSPGLDRSLFIFFCAVGKLAHKPPAILLSLPFYHLTVE